MSFLSAQNISRSYGKIKAVDTFSLDAERGEIFALVGPDGAGKTSFIRVLCHLIDADSGKFVVDGKDAFSNFEAIKPLLGYMPQQFSLYPDLSVEENLTFYGGIFGVTKDRFKKKRDELYEFSALGPFAGRRAGALSGGMKQKLALSCALIHEPEILILDEPTTGVDPLSRRQFWEILLTLKRQGSTILVSTPYMDEVARADRACFMFGGKKLSEGTPTELASHFEGQIFFADIEPTSHVVTDLNKIQGITARRFGAGMHIYIKGDDRIDRYMEPFGKIGISASQLRTIAPELEDRFIQLMEQPA
jgi:ABC-2 type transport system ATP-binding protein